MPKLYNSFRELLEDYCNVPNEINSENHVRINIRTLLNDKKENKNEPYSQEDSAALRVAFIAMQGPNSFYLKATQELAKHIKKHLLYQLVKAENKLVNTSVRGKSDNKNTPEQNYAKWLKELGLTDFPAEKKKKLKQQINVQMQQDAKLYNSFRELLEQYVADVNKGIIEEENTLGGVVEELLRANPASRTAVKEDSKKLLVAFIKAVEKISFKFTRLGERIRTHLLYAEVKEENKPAVQGVQKLDEKKTSEKPKKTPEQNYAKRLKQFGLNDYTAKHKAEKKQQIQSQMTQQGAAKQSTTQSAPAEKTISVEVKNPFLGLLITYSQKIMASDNPSENEKKIVDVVNGLLARLSMPDFVNNPNKQLQEDWAHLLKIRLTTANLSLAGSILGERIQTYAVNKSDAKSILNDFKLSPIKTKFRENLEQYCGKTGECTWFRHHHKEVAEVLDKHDESTTDAALYAALQKKLNPTAEDRTAVKSIGGFATTLRLYLSCQNATASKNKQTAVIADPEITLAADFKIYKP